MKRLSIVLAAVALPLSACAAQTARIAASSATTVPGMVSAADPRAAAAGVVGSARVLAWEAVQSDGGHAAVAKQEALGAPSVRFVAIPAPVIAAATAPVAAPVATPAAAAPAMAAASVPAAPIEEGATLPDLGFGDVIDEQAMKAFELLCRTEGIIPAIESAHALAGAIEVGRELGPDALLLVNLSGRGDKDIFTVAEALGVAI